MPVRLPRTALVSRARAHPLPLTRTLATSSPSYQTQTSSPSPKITAAPFKLMPAEALRYLHVGALMSSGRPLNLAYASLLNIFGDFIATLAREFGYSSGVEQKGEMKAVLWPGWRVDAALEGKAKMLTGDKKNKRVETDMFWTVPGAYVPGHAFAPLSYLSHISPVDNDLPTYQPAEDLRQLEDEGMDIVPVPFTVSPLGLAKHLRKIVGKRSNWDDFIVDEARWKEVMLACYPIMFPLYIAEFTYDDGQNGKRTIPVVMEGHSDMKHEIQLSFPPPPALIQEGRFDKSFFWNPIPSIASGTVAAYPLPEGSSFRELDIAKPFMMFNSYMSPPPNLHDLRTIDPSPMLTVQEEEEPEGVNWDDPRVQSWSGPERPENAVWLGMKATYEATQQGLDAARKRGGMPFGDAMKRIQESLASDKGNIEAAKPAWLKLWDEAREVTSMGKKDIEK